MKRSIFLSFPFLVILVLTLAGCEKNFDAKIYGTLNPESYPSTAEEYESYSMICYIPFGSTWQYYLGEGYNTHPVYTYEGGGIRMFDMPTDEMFPWTSKGWDSEWKRNSRADFSQAIYYYRGNSSGDNLNHITKLSHVTRLTEVLGRVQAADPSVFIAGKKEQLVGEVALCRAMLMYFIYHVYGPMPLIVNPADVENEDVQKDIVRPTQEQMCRWIYDDMVLAVDNLPETVAEKGRYNRDYARFCLMKHCLNEGADMDGWYDKAEQMYEELTASGRYGLYTDGENPYMKVFSYYNKWNREIIMAVSNETNGGTSYEAGNFFPYQKAFMPADISSVDNNGNPTPFTQTGWAQYYNVAQAFYDQYETGDLRKAAVTTEYWVKPAAGGNPTKKQDPSSIGVGWDGYLITKWPYETDTANQGHDWPLARWADVLLMKAELDVRRSGAAPSAETVSYVNEVRSRAGLGALPASATASADAFLNAVLDERGREFLFEGMRKIDLIRFNKYAQKTAKVKGFTPTHQYLPLPNFFVEQAKAYGKNIEQEWSRPGWTEDLAKANSAH